MGTRTARGPQRFDFGVLSPGDFEQLCFLVVHIDFRDAVRFANPDGGAECGTPQGEGHFSRCWQAKRFTGQVSWVQCERSLDAAVKNFGMPHYTFCFAKDLTNPQLRQFQRRLARRHDGVNVDYWGHGKLEAMLLTTEQGERIANHFWEDPALNTKAFMAALRAGGALETGVDAFQRLDAIADYLATYDPYYDYTVVVQGRDAAALALTPATVLSVQTGATRIDAVPRHPNVLRSLPEGTLHFDDTPEGMERRARFDRFMRLGGQLQLDDARFELRNLPPLFASMDEGSSALGTILLTAPRKPIPPWDARFRADTDRGSFEIDMSLQEVQPPDDWDAALSGTFGGLTVNVSFRVDDRPEMRTHWSYSYTTGADIRPQALALAFIDAVHGSGTVAISDNSGVRPTLTERVNSREVDDYWQLMRRFIDGLVTIEDWTGHTFVLPEDIPSDDVEAVLAAALVIQERSSSMTFDHVELMMPTDKYAAVFGGPGRVAVGETFGITFSGEEVWIGELRGELSDVEVEAEQVEENGEELMRVLIRPKTEEARHPVFGLYPLGTEFTLAPSPSEPVA